MNILYKPTFVRQYKKLPKALQKEIQEKITLFKQEPRHPFLKTHKLRGPLKGRLSFSVNYQYRIVFRYVSSSDVELLAVGDHSLYT